MYSGYFGFVAEGRRAVLRVVGSKGKPLTLAPYLGNASGPITWGDISEGSARLALSILLDALGDPLLAMDAHAQFAEEVVAKLTTPWTLSRGAVLTWYVNTVRYAIVTRTFPERTFGDGQCGK